jgi:hypothetical protein
MLYLSRRYDLTPLKCFCGAKLEVVKEGKILRCPVEGIIYEYPGGGEGGKETGKS